MKPDYENEFFTLHPTDKQAFTEGYQAGFLADFPSSPVNGHEAYTAGYAAGSRDRNLED